MNWPDKNNRQSYEINEFVKNYKEFPHGRNFEIIQQSDKPDYIVKDINTNEHFGIELTSVYLDNRSVPDNHILDEDKDIPYNPQAIETYKARLKNHIIDKIEKANESYNKIHPLILSIYANEYLTIHMEDKDWQDFANKNGNIWDNMNPFTEIVLWSLAGDKAFSIKNN